MIDKPQPNEYAPFANAYVKLVNANVIDMLASQQQESYALLSQLSEENAGYAYAAGKWTIKEVVGHLIDAERVFAYRAMCISRGEQQSLPGFEQDDYVDNAGSNDRAIHDLALEFKTLREASLIFIRSLSEEQVNAMGFANNHLASVRALVYIMAGHERHHLNILKERYL